jgi:D-3-phosphoglycerate dehydrogenase
MISQKLGQVLITSHIFGITHPDAFDLLARERVEYDLQRRPAGSWSETLLIDLLRGKQGIIAGTEEPLHRRVIEACPDLKVISRLGVGVDNVDVAAATGRGIVVTITLDANLNATADLTFALILAVARKIPELDRIMREGRWQLIIAEDVSQKTLGIIGLGKIGKAVARRARGFDMRILAYDKIHDPDFAEEYGIRYVSLEELLSSSDFVTVHLSPSPQTAKFIGEAQLNLMKPTAFLINASRGIIIDEAALVRALQGGWIAGAGLDVYEKEPLQESPLLALPNVVLTPHIGGATCPALRAMSLRSAKNAIQVLRGERPEGVVNPEVCTSGSKGEDD